MKDEMMKFLSMQHKMVKATRKAIEVRRMTPLKAVLQREKSVNTDLQTSSSCSNCKDGIEIGAVGRPKEVFVHWYWITPVFCSCEYWIQAKQEFESRPENIESMREYKMKKINMLLKKSGVWERFKEKRLSDFEDVPALFTVWKKYVEKRKQAKSDWLWLYLRWTIWSWKTHAASAIANELISEYYTEVMFVSIADIANRVKQTFKEWKDSKPEDSTLWEDMKKVELLVIDDFWMENPTEWLKENLFLIINSRYENRKPVIITSNQSLEDISRTYFPQVASRLNEMCLSIQFKSQDRRKTIQKSLL